MVNSLFEDFVVFKFIRLITESYIAHIKDAKTLANKYGRTRHSKSEEFFADSTDKLSYYHMTK